MFSAILLCVPPVIPFVSESPVVDGLRTDAAWAEALVLDDLRVIEPNVGAEPTDPIEVRLVKDQKALWVLFRCWDSAPETIRAVQRGRDPDFSGDDCVYIAVDPVGSRREGRVFSVGAGGGMGDSLLSANGRQRSAWDTPWEAAVQIDKEGWTAEIRLPWEGLQLQPGVDVWHFNFA
ncbi:MAG: carbohydrate binding family 9 domain-containing protein, partial [Planctomycetota bacterium]